MFRQWKKELQSNDAEGRLISTLQLRPTIVQVLVLCININSHVPGLTYKRPEKQESLLVILISILSVYVCHCVHEVVA